LCAVSTAASASVSVPIWLTLTRIELADAPLDAVGEPLDVGHHQVVADQLALLADQVGDELPALEIVLRHAVLDRGDRIACHQLGEICDLFLD
jgi:hypothetical protein